MTCRSAQNASESAAVATVQRACSCGHEDESAGVQAKLRIGPVGDRYEQEADRIADQVVSQGGGARAQPVTVSPLVQRQSAGEEEEELQAKAAGPRSPGAGLSSAAQAVAPAGRPLPVAERQFFETRMGRDLGGVRLHTGAQVDAGARAINARAYTLGRDVAFASGQYDPASRAGRHLIAHELAHTLQQGGGGLVQRRSYDGPPGFEDYDMSHGDRNRDADQDRFGPGGPSGPGGSTLPYHQSAELNDCVKIMGEGSEVDCIEMVTGEVIERPEFKTVPGTSSPVPFDAEVSGGIAKHKFGAAKLTILPDTTSADAKMKNSAHTVIRFPPLATGTNLVDWVSQGGKIKSFTFNADINDLTIQTTYGPQASASVSSGYGRGTTKADKASKNTTLGFHEGRHGVDFIRFLAEHPYPEFRFRTGIKVSVFRAGLKQYTDYIAEMAKQSGHNTDCVGSPTIDESNKAKGKVTTVCKKP